MRWDALFADLEAQSEALERAERAAEVDVRARIEVGALRLLDRLRPAVGTRLRVQCAGPLMVPGVLERVGPDWLLLGEGDGREVLVVLAAVRGVSGLSRLSATPDSQTIVESRLGLSHVLRGVARDRSPVRICRVDGSVLDATVDRVGSDFLEAALHPAGEARRRGEVREIVLVPYPALAAVRR
ncbi:MAG: hypothetical protein DLM58_00235 [Pseudonocardiales bacterium]|nr:MAG: hypothetical protein DLM58_00235 [Pseudonocardiales bacterium]